MAKRNQTAQSSQTILMVRPKSFAYNAQTAGNNAFQNKPKTQSNIADKAVKEFDRMVDLLRREGVEVIVVEDTAKPRKPDAIFPNNWFSTHGKRVITYPMYARNRQLERREDIVNQLILSKGYREVYAYENREKLGEILEGTGSMVLDRSAKIAYACISPRTDEQLFFDWCKEMRYEPVSFIAKDAGGVLVYHTNVLMAIGHQYAVICLDAIPSPTDREKVILALKYGGKKVVKITMKQMENFAGNMLEVRGKDGQYLLVMSTTAYRSLEKQQVKELSKYAKIITPNINTIEKIGGGSVRCMMAEVF